MQLNICALGKRIKIQRKKQGFSQNMLSEMIDKSPTYLSYIESGVKSMSLDTFVDLTNALNTTADHLLQDSLENTAIVTNSNLTALFLDCSTYEQKVLLDLTAAAKKTLRVNAEIYSKQLKDR